VVILFSTVDFWALLVITQVIAIGPRFLLNYIQSNYYPTDNNLIREMAVLKKPKHRSAAHIDEEADFGNTEKKHSMSSMSHLDKQTSRNPPLAYPSSQNSSQQNLEMSEMNEGRASFPYEPHQFPPTSPPEQRNQQYDSTLSPPKQLYGHSAIPMVPARSRQGYPTQSATHPDAYEEIAFSNAPSAPASPSFERSQYLQTGRERQDSNTPLTPHLYEPSYGSPPLSPMSRNSSHYRSNTGSSPLTRQNSTGSFATAMSQGYIDQDVDYQGYAR